MKICKQCGQEKLENFLSEGQGKCKTCRSQKAKQKYKQILDEIEKKLEEDKQKEETLNTERKKKDEDDLRSLGWDEARIKKRGTTYKNGKRCLF